MNARIDEAVALFRELLEIGYTAEGLYLTRQQADSLIGAIGDIAKGLALDGLAPEGSWNAARFVMRELEQAILVARDQQRPTKH